ncbi:HlyD family secretion protein [Providencia rettgeri]|nr:HlyD family secretion protein [Providencia rettgeri]
MKPVSKFLLTLLLIVMTGYLLSALWKAYVLAPWTRDGRVSAQIVRIAPEVSGTVLDMAVMDNQFVKAGEVLYRLDPVRFQLAVEQAQSEVAAATAVLNQRTAEAKRRRGMDSLVPAEEIQQAQHAVLVAQAEQRSRQLALDLAKLDLQRSVLYAPTDGYVTRLRLNSGDYAVAGQANLALLDARSFWMTGYFEETKLQGIQPGAVARIRLMGYEGLIEGRVSSIGRGITDLNQQADAQGLPSVEPNFSWIRLAQRIPVRVEFERLPADLVLAAGMTGSVAVGPAQDEGSAQGRISALLQRWL